MPTLPSRLALTALVAFVATCRPTSPAPVAKEATAAWQDGFEITRDGATESWVTVTQSKLAAVDVERALYDKLGEPHFFVRVRVRSLSDQPFGVALRHFHQVIYPNQWTALATPHRDTINEGRVRVPELSSEEERELRRAFWAEALLSVPAHGSLDYYREFNASWRADVDEQARGQKYVVVSMDGWLRVSTGREVEQVPPPKVGTPSEVTIEAPVVWRHVPEGAIVLIDRP